MVLDLTKKTFSHHHTQNGHQAWLLCLDIEQVTFKMNNLHLHRVHLHEVNFIQFSFLPKLTEISTSHSLYKLTNIKLIHEI